MTSEIELKAMNDHDLIVMAVMQGNETVRHLEKINSSLQNHEKRITRLETNTSISGGCNNDNLSRTQKIAYSGYGAAVAIVIYAIYYVLQLLR